MLDAGPVHLEVVLQLFLDGAIVLVLVHVDEIDHDETSQVAQAHLAAGFLSCLEVRPHSRLLNVALTCRLAGVHIDRNQGFGLVDDEIAAGFQLDGRGVDGIELLLDRFGHEKRVFLFPLLNLLGLARHDELGEILRFAIGLFTMNKDLLDILVEHVAHCPVDETALGIDQHRSFGCQCLLDNVFPKLGKIFIVTLDLGLGALGACGPHDQAHAVRHIQLGDDGFQALAVCAIDDLAGNAASARRVRHQDRVATGEGEIGGQGCALVATFFLDDLDKHHLTATNDFLDLVALGDRSPAGLLPAGCGGSLGFTAFIIGGVFRLVRVIVACIVVDVVFIVDVDCIAIFIIVVFDLGSGLFGCFLQQGFAVFRGQLVIVGVDFAEGQETVAIAAILNECRLKRRLYTRYFCEVDVSAELFVASCFKVKVVDLTIVDDRNTGLFRVRGVD